MIKQYKRENWVFPKDGRPYVESVDIFTFATHPGRNDLMTVNRNGISKTVSIEDCGSEYVYKLTKSRIIAKGGARGLFDFMDKALFEHFMDCHAWRILCYVTDQMRPARVPERP